jgi:hypothetical protein
MPTRTPTLLLVTLLLPLAGCVSDTASYMIDGDRKHAITLARAQPYFWDSRVKLSVIAARQPDCLGGLDIRDVPRSARIELHRAPDEYPEPLYLLSVGQADYAVSTRSCRVQKFPAPVANKGQRLGHFQEDGGRFAYHPAPA